MQELAKIQDVYAYLFEPDAQGRSFARFFWHDNVGFSGMRDISHALLDIGVPPGTCCREMGFVRGNHSFPLRHHPHRHMSHHSTHFKMTMAHGP